MGRQITSAERKRRWRESARRLTVIPHFVSQTPKTPSHL